MSTVLRPVGPLDPRVYWIRRAALGGFLAIVIVVIAVSCSGGSGSPSGGHHNGTRPRVTPSATSTSVAACDPAVLTISMSTDTATYTSGQAPTLIATLGNPTGPTCKLARSAANEIWTVKSGPPTVWTTQGCPSTTTSIPKQMKIASGATKRLSMQWNGHLRSSSCQDLGVAQAGTYTAMASIDGVAVPAKKAAIFHITG